MKIVFALLYLLSTVTHASFYYEAKVSAIEHFRSNVAYSMKKARTEAEKKDILADARLSLEEYLVEEIFPEWYGTTWDFNGITDTPKVGEIACGYFVSQTLKDVGFKFHRNRLAQQPSSFIIRTFSTKEETVREIGKPIEDFLDNVEKKLGDGLYIVGLDNHVGFLWFNKGERRLIHSSYFPGKSYVLSERAIGLNPLTMSNWKEAGKLFSDDMIKKWLKNEEFPIFKK